MHAEALIDPPAVETQIDAEAARAAATEFLLDNVGQLIVAGEPQMMVSAVRAVWIVPVDLAYIHYGVLGTVGVVAVDSEIGQVVAWTPILTMKANARSLRARHEPELSEKFRAAMSAQKQPGGE